MAGPWKQYAQTEQGPWSKYSGADSAPVTAGGVFAEGAKGLVRGASDAALMAGKAALQTRLGPLAGLAGEGLDMLVAPSRSLVESKAQNKAEQFAGTTGEIFGGGAVGGGVRSVGAAALNAMGALGGATGEQVGGPWGRLLGTLSPVAASMGAPAAIKGLIRGGETGRQALSDRLATFRAAGIEAPSAGQATGSRALQATESAASKVPGSAGIMAKSAEAEAEGMGQRIEEIAGSLSPGATGTKAGMTIERGIQSFVERFKGEQGTLYGTLDKYIPKDRPVSMENTLKTMATLNADIPGAPALSKFFKNSTIQELESAMKSDSPQLQGISLSWLPYDAMKQVRTLVGREMENTNLLSQVPRSKWKALYGALSKDMEAAATEAGPDAVKAFSRANAFSSAGYGRIESILDRVAGKDTVEKVFQAAVAPSEIKEGASTINAVMRSLKPEERDIVKAAVVKRLGQAQASAQDAAGEVFSSQSFLTNWNKISPEAKQILFAGQEGKLRASLDTVAKAASMIREGSKVFSNPSGTSQSIANIGGAIGVAGSLATGNVPMAMMVLTGIVGSNLTARLLTNPKFVDWLATTTKASPALLPLQIGSLAQTVGKMKDEELKDDATKYARALLRQSGQMGSQQQMLQPQ